jgi:hypothetical protein
VPPGARPVLSANDQCSHTINPTATAENFAIAALLNEWRNHRPSRPAVVRPFYRSRSPYNLQGLVKPAPWLRPNDSVLAKHSP